MKHCWVLSTSFFKNKKFVDNTQQCFAFMSQAKFPAHNLNFHWMWRCWDWIRSISLNLFYFTNICFIMYIWGTNKYETPCRGNEAIFAVVEKSCFAASQYNEVHFLAMMAILGWNIFSKSILIFLHLTLNIL